MTRTRMPKTGLRTPLTSPRYRTGQSDVPNRQHSVISLGIELLPQSHSLQPWAFGTDMNSHSPELATSASTLPCSTSPRVNFYFEQRPRC